MQMTVTAKLKIDVESTSKESLIKTMSAYTDACNHVSSYVYKTHDLKQSSLNKVLYHDLRNMFSLRSQMAQSVMRNVIARYKTILENEGEWIKPVFKHLQYELVWNRDYSLVKNQFSVNTLDGRLKVSFHDRSMEKYFNTDIYTFGSARLVYKKDKFILHIPVTFETDECKTDEIQNIVGVDLGVNFLATSYASNHKTMFFDGRKVKAKRAHYKILRKQLQQVKTPSSRKRLKAIGSRENRWMNDVNHQISKALVESNPERSLFVLEDLTGIRNATEKVKTRDRYVMVSWAFYDLAQKIEYKSQIKGSKTIKVSPRYTSQTCPLCGHTEKSNRHKDKHIFVCKSCGYKSNDDRIGAMNLYRKGIEWVSSQVPDTVALEHVS